MNWFRQWRYRRRLAWLLKNDVIHYAMAEIGPALEVFYWPKKKLLWMRDIERYLMRADSKIGKLVAAEVREQVKEKKNANGKH
jgi:hypothetical protein